MFARRSIALARSTRALHTTALLSEKSVLESKLRDSLKTAMKARDKAAVSTLKVSRARLLKGDCAALEGDGG